MNYRQFCSILAVLGLFSFSSSPAQYRFWHKVLDGEGESVGMNPINPYTVYGQDGSGRLRVSHDAGVNWSNLGFLQDQTREILVSPRDTSTLFTVSFFNGLWRSVDGGSSWSLVLNNYGIDGVSVEYDPQHPDTIFAGNFNDAAVYRSTDRGATWTLRGHASDGNLCTIAIRPDSSNILYAGAGGGRISKSTNYGATWRYVKPGGSTEIPRIVIDQAHPAIAYACAYESSNPNDLGVWKTTDYGESWQHTGLVNVSVWSLDIDQQHPDTVYAGSFSGYQAGVYRTTDGGATWTLFDKGYFPYNSMWNMKVDQLHPENVYSAATIDAFGYLGIFKLTDSDAGVEGYVRDSLTGTPLTSGTVYLSPYGDLVNVAYTGGHFEFYRPLTDTVSTYTLSYYVGGVLSGQQTVSFQHGNVVTQDILVTRGVIEGTVFNDSNADGTQQGGEAGVPDWIVQLTGAATQTTTTDANGFYQFANLPDGSYTVTVARKYGYSPTSATSYSIGISAGAKSHPGRDFGSRFLPTASAVTPTPFSVTSAPSTILTATFSAAVNPATFNDTNGWLVWGARSGRHAGTISFNGENTVATFTPALPFQRGEAVTAELTSNIHMGTGEPITPFSYQFSVASEAAPMDFSSRSTYTVGTSPWGLAVADFDGDNDNDIVVANSGSNSISVLLNDGTGSFGSKTNYATPSVPRCVATGDIDNDGDIDIVTGNGAQTVSVFFNNGDGTFSNRTEYPGNGSVYSILIADMDGDGRLDIVTTSITGDNVSVLKNLGGGTFAAAAAFDAKGAPWGSCLADVNHDGGVDVVVSNAATSSTVATAMNLGGGDLSVNAEYATGNFSRSAVAADLNGDSYPDVAATNNTSSSISVYSNSGSGTLAGRTDVTVGTGPWGIDAGDVDGDGHVDLVTANLSSNNVSVLRNTGGGSLSDKEFRAGNTPRMVVVADVDGDGQLDLIVTNYSAGTVSILFNSSTTGVAIAGGWSLVSIPTLVSNRAATTLFQNAASGVYAYQGAYVRVDSLDYGKGYWVKYVAPDTIYYTGSVIAAETVSVNAKWNLVGGVGMAVPASSVTTIPSGVTLSSFYGYGSGYTVADSLRPGKGYWVKASQACQLVIVHSAAVPATRIRRQEEPLGMITIEDKAGRRQQLVLSAAKVPDAQAYEMPPLPPAGAFDARFANGTMLLEASGVETRGAVNIHDAQYPLTVSWDMPAGNGAWSLLNGKLSVPLTGTGTATIASASEGLAIGYATAGSLLPQSFALEQNYPNPFNPSTMIRYDVKEQSMVTVRVHDVLGREVATLVSAAQAAGSYTTEWNAGSAAGGVYYVTLTAADPAGKPLYRETRKIVLMK